MNDYQRFFGEGDREHDAAVVARAQVNAENRAVVHKRAAVASAIEITTKFDGSCLTCGRGYKAGDRVRWAKGTGSLHVPCFDEIEQRRSR